MQVLDATDDKTFSGYRILRSYIHKEHLLMSHHVICRIYAVMDQIF